MTPEHTGNAPSVLETILKTVRSIDGKVDNLLEQLGEYLEETHYRHSWSNGCHHNGEED
jgi:hypothetical protein